MLHLFSSNTVIDSCISGSKQINRVWTTANLKPLSLSTLPQYFSIEDYRYIILDFPIKQFLDKGFILIVRAKIRRLMLVQLKIVSNYLNTAEQAFSYYKILSKVS